MANQYRSVLASGGASTGGDALPAEVLAGKTFTNDNGAQTGSMTNNGAVSQTLAAGASYTIPEGYHNGEGVVTALASGSGAIILYNTSSGVEAAMNSMTKTGLPSSPSCVVVNCVGKTTVTTDLGGNAYSYDGSTLSPLTQSSSYNVTNYDYLIITFSDTTSFNISVS